MNVSEPKHITLLRETIREFVAREATREDAFRWDRDDCLPRETIAKLADLGVMGLTIPEEYGGAGRDIHAAMAVIEELTKSSTAIVGPFIMAACYGGMNILESGSEEQKRDLLPKLARGEVLFAYGLTEPEVGADLASAQTRARLEPSPDGDTVVINGAKRFCTGATYADYILTLARSEPTDGEEARRYQNLNLILVPGEAPGLSATSIDAIGQRGLGTYDVTFDNVRVPAEQILGGRSQWNLGWDALAREALDVEKLEVAAMALGIGEAAMEDAWNYSQERVQFGVPICAHQAIRHKLARAKTQLHAARLVLYNAADMATRGESVAVESSMAKYFVCEAVQEVVLISQRVMGAYGCVRGPGSEMERYVREALVLPIAGGSSDIQLNNIANRLKLPRR